uniref:Odorant receptor n=1 Tax=Yemma signatus TaxID=300820 RepID=A0A385H5W4_9HEMI|nr:odorant receptor [Yemma signatus]
MSFFSGLWTTFLEYCQSEEIVDKIMKRDYYFLLYMSGLYSNLKERFRLLSVVLFFVNTGIAFFHMYVMVNTLFIISKLNFTLSTFMFQIFMLMQFSVFMLFAFTVKRQTFRQLCREIGTPFAYEGEDHETALKNIAKEVLGEKRKLMILPIFLCLVGANCMLFGPFIDTMYGDPGFNQTEKGFFTGIPISGVYPWHIPEESKTLHFYVLGSLQLLSALFLLSVIGSGTIVFMNVAYFYVESAKYLLHNIDTVESRAEMEFRKSYFGRKNVEDLYSDRRFLKCLENCLKKNFCHHQKLIRLFHLFQDVLSWPIGYAYFTGTIVIALSLLSIKTGTSLPGTAATSLMMCILEVCIMAMLSFLGQRMIDLNEDLRFSIYSLKWFMVQNGVKLDLMILQEMTLRPVELKGFGLVTCNLDTFANVMNSAYSYYNLIMAV